MTGMKTPAEAFDRNNRSKNAREHTLVKTDYHNSRNLGTSQSKGYVSEEEALRDGPLTDVHNTVDVAKSTLKLKGDFPIYQCMCLI